MDGEAPSPPENFNSFIGGAGASPAILPLRFAVFLPPCFMAILANFFFFFPFGVWGLPTSVVDYLCGK
jgi:hypothetical protein